jgi:type II secretory pathway predicted ATPase ExeA
VRLRVHLRQIHVLLLIQVVYNKRGLWAIAAVQASCEMYNSFFGFNQSPFASVPLAQHYFPAAAIESARAKLARCVERGEGIGLVVGRSGLGKTLLCHVLSEGFRSRFQVAMLAAGRLGSRRSLLQALLYSLGKPYRGMDEGDLRLSLLDCLSDTQQYPNGVLLLVDEADLLPLRLLDEIRLFTNLAVDGKPRLRPILAGACRLEERLNSPRLESFNQRIVARCYLEPFAQAETQQYIHTRIKAAGGAAEELFPAETCRSIHVASDGVPRLVNQLCDHVLLLAYVGGRRRIDPALVEEAWQDLQQLPVPVSRSDSPCQQSSGVIEFGQLEDSDDPHEQTGCVLEPPSLRVVSEAAAGQETESEPTVRLAAIESMVERLDDEFRPAGTIKPEVELFFGDDEFPLAQQFEEEELVEVRTTPRKQYRASLGQDQEDAGDAAADGTEVAAARQLGLDDTRCQAHRQAEAASQSARAAKELPFGEPSAAQPVLEPDDSQSAPQEGENRRASDLAAQSVNCMVADRQVFSDGAQADAPFQYMPAPVTCRIAALRHRRFGRLFSTLKWG